MKEQNKRVLHDLFQLRLLPLAENGKEFSPVRKKICERWQCASAYLSKQGQPQSAGKVAYLISIVIKITNTETSYQGNSQRSRPVPWSNPPRRAPKNPAPSGLGVLLQQDFTFLLEICELQGDLPEVSLYFQKCGAQVRIKLRALAFGNEGNRPGVREG